MERIDINSVLEQIRVLKAQAQNAPPVSGSVPGAEASFSTILRQSIDTVNNQQVKSADMAQAFEAGEPGVDLVNVMVEMQKASVSFEAMTQVRNKLLSAYQEVMNMPI